MNYDAVAAKASDGPMESPDAGQAVRVDLIYARGPAAGCRGGVAFGRAAYSC